MTNMKKKMKKTYRKNTKWMAAAVLSAALLSGQVIPVVAGSSSAIEMSTIFPENITVESPVPLSEISLPRSDYGKLSWADDSQVPSKRSEAFEVVFRPYDSFDLSRIDEWDGESEKITGYVTVVVSSIVQTSEEESYTGYKEYTEIVPEDGTSGDVQDQGDNNYEDSLSPTDIPAQSEFAEDQDAGQETIKDSNASEEGETAQPNESGTESDQSNGQNTQEETPDSMDADQEVDGEKSSDTEAPDEKEETDDVLNGEPEAEDQEVPEGTEAPDEPENPDDSEIPDNIFDREDEAAEDNRPVTAEEDLTEEEMQQRAEENHSCDGIYVSGINLPWFVQFRATSGESYEFSNESEASIFRSYEFELWDLKNNTEYEIPDGEYISVTIPVKAGYEYTIEHLLDNGATETIIPSVEGSTMVFSTHSFSPFGIAGSKPLVGGDVAENTYLTPTPTAVPTKTPAGTSPNTTTTPDTNPNTGSNETPGSSNGNSGNGNTSGSGSAGSGETNNGSQSSTKDSAVQNSTTSKAVKTGDNTQILPFVILVAAAVVIIAAVLVLKRNEKQ